MGTSSKSAFLELFRNIESFGVIHLRDKEGIEDYFPDNLEEVRYEDYRLEFTTIGKKRREYYEDI